MRNREEEWVKEHIAMIDEDFCIKLNNTIADEEVTFGVGMVALTAVLASAIAQAAQLTGFAEDDAQYMTKNFCNLLATLVMNYKDQVNAPEQEHHSLS